MKEAGLTRGALYAHYRSKAALFADVMWHEYPLLALLEARAGDTSEALCHEMREIFAAYLDVDNLEDVSNAAPLPRSPAMPRVRLTRLKLLTAPLLQQIAKKWRGDNRILGQRTCPRSFWLQEPPRQLRRCQTGPSMQASLLGAASVAFPSLLPTPDGS